MRYPLDSITITGAFKEVAQPGTGLPDAAGIRRHVGVDLRASVGTKVYAVGSGVVTQSYESSAGQTIELRIGDKLWRFMHLSRRDVKAGDRVTEGQVIALSGNSGGVLAHLHVDARKNGTTWNASLNNYFDPLELIKQSQAPKGGETPMTTAEAQGIVKALYRKLLKREPDTGGLNNYTAHIKAGNYDFAVGDIAGSQEYRNVNTITKTVTVEKPVEVVKEVIKEVERVVEIEDTARIDELTRVVEIKDDEIRRLEAELAVVSDDTANLNALGNALKWLIQRLGINK